MHGPGVLPLRVAPQPLDLENCSITDWLEVNLEVLESCGRIWGELNAKVIARALATSFCALVPAGYTSRSIGRADLRSMKEGGHV